MNREHSFGTLSARRRKENLEASSTLAKCYAPSSLKNEILCSPVRTPRIQQGLDVGYFDNCNSYCNIDPKILSVSGAPVDLNSSNPTISSLSSNPTELSSDLYSDWPEQQHPFQWNDYCNLNLSPVKVSAPAAAASAQNIQVIAVSLIVKSDGSADLVRENVNKPEPLNNEMAVTDNICVRPEQVYEVNSELPSSVAKTLVDTDSLYTSSFEDISYGPANMARTNTWTPGSGYLKTESVWETPMGGCPMKWSMSDSGLSDARVAARQALQSRRLHRLPSVVRPGKSRRKRSWSACNQSSFSENSSKRFYTPSDQTAFPSSPLLSRYQYRCNTCTLTFSTREQLAVHEESCLHSLQSSFLSSDYFNEPSSLDEDWFPSVI
ncbi:MBF transcription factor complex subunit Rep1 [Schizosaccharomyces japonicus yFS275]|uniref:MBF transcription factor complex subunit Rep1 n=1 Tax=Schizosaccharomyces japonicus (strain yFS275 / FY16936) TaxID=402676 RepID=B6K4T4_SCHJY|nr:MBF transcription factor complex subunit Rep1 [Schizosaccharomyces japonicus yFS275]EEB08491.1 MBF transcription factor complex subunit Rep1 [Schizosaccharomyces japonicus yFS275]